jgi:hypothetical protein
MSSSSETAGPIEEPRNWKKAQEITLSAFAVNVRTNVGGPSVAGRSSFASVYMEKNGRPRRAALQFPQLERKSHRQLHLPWVAHTLT